MLRRKTADLDELDLYPADDGIPMEDGKHQRNAALLMETLDPWLEAAGIQAFTATNNFIYYQHGDPKKACGPDFYVVLGAQSVPDRDCWRVWNEDGLLPQVIVEFVSKSTARKDRVKNFAIYRDVLKVRNYFICDNRRMRLDGWVLEGDDYVPRVPDQQGRIFCDALGLSLGFASGYLRFFEQDGRMLPTGREAAEQAANHAARERQRCHDLEAEVARLRAQLEQR